MPSSTTLETLVLEIDSSAVKANEGIGRTVGSLRSLAKAVGTVLPGLREMNRELLKTSRLKIPNIGGSITRGARKPKTPSVIPETAGKFIPSTPYNLDPKFWNSLDPQSQKVFEKVYRYQYHQQQLADQQRRQAELDQRRKIFNDSLKQNPVTGTQELTTAAKAAKETATGIREIGENAEKSKPKVSGFAKSMGMVGRIFKTMLIRTVIRSLIKSFTEAWNAAYEFSKKMGGSFSTAVDRAKTMLTDVGVSLVQTIAPAFEAIIPVLKVVTDAIQYLCQGIQDLFRWFGLVSDVTNANTASIGKYTNAAGKGGKATKNMLASWDQLNVIQSKGGSGGSGGASYKPGSLKNIVSTETGAIMQMIVGESMLAIGLILACTGHIGLGIGAIAIGAAAIVKTLTVDWKKLPDNVKNTITGIMTVAGTAMIALGLIVCGANLPLGIGMIVAGAANLGIATALNWDGIVERLNGIMADIGAFFVNTWTDIKSAIGRAWGAVSRWWTDNISTPIANAWDSVKTFFVNLWGSAETGTGIAGWASNAWKDVSTWWETNVTANVEKEGVWGGVKGFFTGIFDTVSTHATNAWNTVNDWMDENIGTSFRTAWGSVKGVFESIFGTTEQPDTVVGMIHGAFQDVEEWWTTNIKGNVDSAWKGVSTFFKDLFGTTENPDSVVGRIHGAWQDVSEWWNTNVTEKVKENGAWGGVVGFFEGIIGDSETGLEGLFNGLWTNISLLWGNIVGNLESAWSTVGTWFHDNVTMPVGNFFVDCINGIIDGINWVIKQLNKLNITLWDGSKIGISGIGELDHVQKIKPIGQKANGAYGIPRGDLFVANEAGAELVGTMNGKTTVANQGQIIEGIQKGVRDANADQNELLRQQNDLLRQILRKRTEINPRPSAAWGQFISESSDLWTGMTGG